MQTDRMMDFLLALDANNNREWFHANKAWYQEAQAEFEALVLSLLTELQVFDEALPFTEPKALTFKLMRDTRFSHDKRPYNAAFRAHISYQGKLPIPCGYYVSLRPGDGSMLGGGLFASMFADATRRVRDAIAADGPAFEHMAVALELPIRGEKLKRVPAGYDAALPQAEFLKHKSWYVETLVPDALIRTPEQFLKEAVWAFQQMKPLNDYLNRALEGFVMPAR